MSGSIFFEATKVTVANILEKHPKPGGYWKKDDGKIKIAQPCAWYTNLDHKKRHEELILYRRYSPEDYPHYDNYDAIEVSKTKDIPMDWDGAMGVPITFLDKYNPDQFEVLGSSRTLGIPMSKIAEPGTYQQGGPRFYLSNGDGTHRRLYDRLVVRNKALQP